MKGRKGEKQGKTRTCTYTQTETFDMIVNLTIEGWRRFWSWAFVHANVPWNQSHQTTSSVQAIFPGQNLEVDNMQLNPAKTDVKKLIFFFSYI